MTEGEGQRNLYQIRKTFVNLLSCKTLAKDYQMKL